MTTGKVESGKTDIERGRTGKISGNKDIEREEEKFLGNLLSCYRRAPAHKLINAVRDSKISMPDDKPPDDDDIMGNMLLTS